jgi:flagellar biosynthesis/type III secretory pathway chaperone
MENGMENLLNALSDCVDRQLNLYRKLLDLFHAERGAILTSDLEGLNRVIMDKELVLQHIRTAELARRKTADQLAPQLGLDAGTLTLTKLIERIDGPYASRMKDKGKRLQTLIDEIQVVSERNRSLCLQALHFVSGSIKLLSTLTRPNQVYHASGRIHNTRHLGRMLSGAV